MKGELYNPGQPLKKEDLDHEKYSLQDSVSDRLVDTFTSGVLYNSQENGETLPFEITSAGGLFINVGTGVAYASGLVDSSDPTETGGERIHIPTADVGIGDNYQRNPGAGPGSGTGNGPFKESDDGLGGWYATPQSTLTRLIPVVNATTNYIWLGYLHAIDPSIYSLHKATSGRIYPKGIDGYDIIVTQTAGIPVFNGNANYQLLGTVVTTGGAITGISQTAMAFARVRQYRAGIVINSATPPATYSNGQTKFLDDHINAMGTGSGPSVKNPHNQKLEDFGVATVDVDLVGHRRDHHSTGLVGNPSTPTSSLAPFTDPSTPEPSPAVAMVFLKQLISGESLTIDGQVYDEVIDKLLAPSGSGATGDAYVSFLNTDPAGTYYLYISPLLGEAKLYHSTTAPGLGSYLIGTVGWSGSAFTTSITDARLFGLTGAKDIQAGAVGTSELADLSVTTAKIAATAVTAAKMATDSVATASIQALAVTTAKIDAAAVTDVKLATDSVITAKVQANAITEPKIADDAVHSRQVDVADGTTGQDTTIGSGIKTAHIQDEAITTSKLDVNLAGAFVPTGGIISYGGLEGSIPAGWVVCDGRVLNGALPVNAALFSIIGTTWGGSGFNFNTPDLRGVFLRGINTTSNGQAVGDFRDPNEALRTKRDGISPATGVGSYQRDMIGEHNHNNVSVIGHDGGPGISSSMSAYSATNNPGGFNESRPKNAYVLFIIKL